VDRRPVGGDAGTVDGVIVVDKPGGRSSAGGAEDVKRIVGATRAGHAGTLDPMATGVLVVCLGEATKVATYLLADDKEYEAELVLGVETDTLDRTGAIVRETPGGDAVSRAAVEAALARFLGEQDQVPPMYSAIKQGGVRLYHQARRGVEVERPPRRIRIDRLELVAFAPPRLRVAIACSKGTYVRSLVADLGTALGTGAHLTELRRTRSGKFAIADAITFDALRALSPAEIRARLVAPAAATELPSVTFPAALRDRVDNGVQDPPAAFGVPPELAAGGAHFQLVDEGGALRAIVHVADGKTVFDRVFKA
jgi:tRNA pseudouridine55 synthase